MKMKAELQLTSQDRFRGALLGLACGDAVGTTVEFESRGTFVPSTDMVGGDPFGLRQGEWTDDTSMALCLAASLIEQQGFDPHDQLTRYCRWRNHGYMSSTGRCFDIGNTTSAALGRFERLGTPYCSDEVDSHMSAANGCLMRLAPVPMWFYPDCGKTIHFAGLSARTTHGALECLDATKLFGAILHAALSGACKDELLFETASTVSITSNAVKALPKGSYAEETVIQIHGSFFVVDALEAALWCFLNTDSFEAAILAAANLGDDADTTAAICGQVAGAYYGESGIPDHWLQHLFMAEEIRALADGLRLHHAI
jgi:ADP-ribosyl-[dinitrogen reductase] hydrolase